MLFRTNDRRRRAGHAPNNQEENIMPAYLVVEVEVHDLERYEKYKSMVPPSLAAYGGRFMVRGGKVENLEGDLGAETFRDGRVPFSWRAQRPGGTRMNMLKRKLCGRRPRKRR